MVCKLTVELLDQEVKKINKELEANGMKAVQKISEIDTAIAYLDTTALKEGVSISAPLELLMNEKKRMENETKKESASLRNRLEDYKSAIQLLSTTCPQCDGDGKYRRPDAAGQLETIKCPNCGGSGRKY